MIIPALFGHDGHRFAIWSERWELIECKEEYSVGVPEFDEQHKGP